MLVSVITEVSCFLQLATQAGNLNVPQWYESGKIIAEAHPEIPQRAFVRHSFSCQRGAPLYQYSLLPSQDNHEGNLHLR